MTLVRLLLAVLLASAVPARAADPDAAQAHVVAHAVDGYIRPAFADFAKAGGRLRDTVDRFCAAPDAAGHDAVADAYRAALTAFARIEFLRFGPLLVEHRLERLLFWPDRKSTGRRQAEQIVATRDDSALTLASLRGKSVAVQGLSAMEVTLFDGARQALLAQDDDGRFRCAYGRVLAENVAAIGAELAAEWASDKGIARALREPGEANDAYRTHQEAAAEIIGALTTGLQIIRDQQLLPVIGSEIAKARPRMGILRRSENTVTMYVAAASGLADMVAAMDLAAVLDAEDAWLADGIAFELSNVRKALAEVPEPLTETLADPLVYGKLAYVDLVLGNLRETIGENLSAALAITMGFNALDGD